MNIFGWLQVIFYLARSSGAGETSGLLHGPGISEERGLFFIPCLGPVERFIYRLEG